MHFSNWKNALECSSAHHEAVELVETIAVSIRSCSVL